MRKYPGLKKRGSTYWYRKQVPADLQKIIGQCEIKRTLATGNEREAIGRYHQVAAEIETRIEQARGALRSGDWPQRCEQEFELIAHDWWMGVRQTLTDPLTHSRPRFYDDEDFVTHLRAYLAEAGINIPPNSSTFEHVRKAARVEAGSHVTDVIRLTDATARAEADLRQGRHDPEQQRSAVRPSGRYGDSPGHAHYLLSDMLSKYLGERKLDTKSAGEWARAIRLFQEHAGRDITVRSITKAMVRGFKDSLLKMPKSLPKQMRQCSLPDLVALCETNPEFGGREKLLPTTVNKLLSALSSVLDYAMSNGYIDENPAIGIRALDPCKASRERQNYSVADLRLIFTSGPYQTPSATPANRGADFWLPLLGLWTGARLEELGQALVTDIWSEAPYPFFDINAVSDGKRLKTPGSKRRVPLHSELIKCGFLKYVEALRDRGEIRLFPELRANRHGSYTQSFSTQWARFTDKIGINDPRKVFHSFRHAFIDRCRASRQHIAESVEKVLVGHADPTVHAQYGSEGYPLEVLADAINVLHYPGLHLTHLHV